MPETITMTPPLVKILILALILFRFEEGTSSKVCIVIYRLRHINLSENSLSTLAGKTQFVENRNLLKKKNSIIIGRPISLFF